MPAGDYGAGTTLRVNAIRCIPDQTATIAYTLVDYDLILPSGLVQARTGWRWAPSQVVADQIRQLGQALLADLLTFEGVGLWSQPAPQISSVAVGSITSTGATITWSTDTPADSNVHYGTDANYGTNASEPSLVTGHQVALIGLTPATTYHFQVESRDATGVDSASGDLTFTTTA